MSCLTKPKKIIDTKDGVKKDPILYNALLDATSNSAISLLVYEAIDEEFVNKYGMYLDFDSQGMPTYASLSKLPVIQQMIKMSNDDVLKNLSKRYGTGTYNTFEEAISRAQGLNNNPSFNSKYLGIIKRTRVGKGKYTYAFSIVDNTSVNRQIFANEVKQESFRNRLVYALTQAHVNVKFLDEYMDGLDGVYTSVSPEKTFDTLYNAIKIAAGVKDELGVLKEETGHLILNIAENNDATKTLCKRFIDSIKKCDNNTLRQILQRDKMFSKDEIDQIISDITSDEAPAREAAGRILMSVLGEYQSITDKNGSFVIRLARRIGAVLKTVFNNIRYGLIKNKAPEDIPLSYEQQLAKDNIISEARELAGRFMSGKLGTIEDAFNSPEVRHHARSVEARAAHNTILSFEAFIRYMKNIGGEERKYYSSFEEKVGSILKNTEAQKRISPNIGYAAEAVGLFDEITAIVKSYSENEWQDVLAGNFLGHLNALEIDGDHIPDLNTKIQGLSKMLVILQMGKQAYDALSLLKNSKEPAIAMLDVDGKLKVLNDLMTSVSTNVDQVNRQLFIATLATINNGKDYIIQTTRMGWGKEIEGRQVSIAELLDGYATDGSAILEDGTGWELWARKMQSSVSVVNQLAANLYDFNKAEANKEMYQYSQRIMNWHERVAKELGKEDTTWMYEIDEDGNLTGNIVQPNYNYGKWENDYKAFLEQSRAEWKKYKEDNNIHYQYDVIEGKAWTDWFKDKYIKWHQDNSQTRREDYDDELYTTVAQKGEFELKGLTTYYLPAEKYKSSQWDNLTDKQRSFLKEYATIKQSLDEYIEEYHPGSITSYRMPQYREKGISRLRQATMGDNGQAERNQIGLKKFWRLQHDKVLENFFVDAQDEDFGDNSCYNNADESFFDMKNLDSREYSRRIPVFGVNKLKDMHNLSTNAAMSLMQYAAMAINVGGMRTTALVLENGLSVINKTEINGIQEEQRKGAHTNVYNRYCKFLEMQVFGQRSNLIRGFTVHGHSLCLNKVSSWITREASLRLLGGNIPSGVVNTGTGCFQILKEAFVGEDFDMKELIRMVGEYKKYQFESLANGDIKTLNNESKYGAYIRYFDALNDARTYYSNFRTHEVIKGKKGLGVLSQLRRLDFLMWPYESGNRFMQTLPYALKGVHTKLYILKEGVPFEGEHTEDDFEVAGNVYDTFNEKNISRSKINSPLSNSTADDKGSWGDPYADLDLTKREQYYVKDNDGNFSKWDRTAQSLFQTKCRLLTDNLHGVYNDADASAASQEFLVSSALVMRKYIFGYIDRFYMGDRYSVADKENIEGCVISFAKMLHLYGFHKTGHSAKMATRIALASVPFLSSMTLGFLGSQAISGALQLMYYPMVKGLFNKKTMNTLKEDKFSKQQIYGLKRFNQELKMITALRLIALLLTQTGGSVKRPDDDKKRFRYDDLAWGTKADIALLKELGYKDYLKNIKDDILNKDGTLKDSAKFKGVLYTYVNHHVKDEKLNNTILYGMGSLYYFFHRWSLEQNTISAAALTDIPAALREYNTEVKEWTKVLPVVYSVVFSDFERVGNVIGNVQSTPTYEYDKSVKDWDFNKLNKDFDKWPNPFLDKWAKYNRTVQHWVFGDNKGMQDIWNSLPGNGTNFKFADDPYEASKSYDQGRVR